MSRHRRSKRRAFWYTIVCLNCFDSRSLLNGSGRTVSFQFSALKSSLSGNGLSHALTGHDARFTIVSRDVLRRPLTSGGLNINVLLRGSVDITANVKDNGDGTYDVVYQLPVSRFCESSLCSIVENKQLQNANVARWSICDDGASWRPEHRFGAALRRPMHGMVVGATLDVRRRRFHRRFGSRLRSFVRDESIESRMLTDLIRFFLAGTDARFLITARDPVGATLDIGGTGNTIATRYFSILPVLKRCSFLCVCRFSTALGATITINGARRVVQIIDNHDGSYGARYAVPSDATVNTQIANISRTTLCGISQ